MARHLNADVARKRNKAISDWARNDKRKCPKCKRGKAISKLIDNMGITRWCRYEDCDYDSFYMFK